MTFGKAPIEVTTDRAPVYPRVIDELAAGARHVLEQYANNVIEADHGRLKARLPPMRGLNRLRCARTIATGHAFVQNLRRRHYEITTEQAPHDLLPAAFAELAHRLRTRPLTAHREHARIWIDQPNSAPTSGRRPHQFLVPYRIRALRVVG